MSHVMELRKSKELLIELSVEFYEAAAVAEESERRAKELMRLRRSSAFRLLALPKMGYEHIYFQAIEDSYLKD